ncbi:MAG TPA: protein-disulfide reductase DsbD domain-containing protein, partial [Bacteroidota bacterium]|nr:protein-disulfide reductase DsbD domain-containing protein [Bacteroidota bacterium]
MFSVLLSFLMLGTPMPTESSHSRVQETSPVTSVTLTTPAQDFTEPFTAVIHLTLAPDWYLYWTNPGDAGLPLTVRWKLPEGFRAGELRFPTPGKIVHEDIIAYGYYRELIVLCTLTPPPGYRTAEKDTLRADVSWLVCSESCMPGKASAMLPLSEAGYRAPGASELVARFTRLEPAALTDLGISPGTAVATRMGGELLIHIPLTGAIDDFYPDPIADCV